MGLTLTCCDLCIAFSPSLRRSAATKLNPERLAAITAELANDLPYFYPSLDREVGLSRPPLLPSLL